MFTETPEVRKKLRVQAWVTALFATMAAAMILPLLLIVGYLVVEALPVLSWEFLSEPPRNNPLPSPPHPPLSAAAGSPCGRSSSPPSLPISCATPSLSSWGSTSRKDLAMAVRGESVFTVEEANRTAPAAQGDEASVRGDGGAGGGLGKEDPRGDHLRQAP